jgi:DNA-binding MarR family transcriptional regulator
MEAEMGSGRTPGTASAPKGRLSDADYRNQADFRCALRKFVRFSEEQARILGITPQQHLMLLIIRGHRSYPGVSIGEVAKGLQIRHHAASLLVDRAVRRELILREEDPSDRRRALVTLTPEGQELLDTITLANRQELGSPDNVLFRKSFIDAIKGTTTEASTGSS